MGYKKKTSTDKVPPEIVLGLKHGKLAYQQHESWHDEPDAICMALYLICGKLIRGGGLELWTAHRAILRKRSDIGAFWAHKEFEKRIPKRK